MKKCFTILLATAGLFSATPQTLPLLTISANKRYFETNGKPFFWLGDTAWLLLSKCNKQETISYLDIRHQQGFNVIQVMVLHTLAAVNRYDDSALVNKNPATPNTAKQNDAQSYWGNIDMVITEAAKRNMYIALVPLWGSNVKDGKLKTEQVTAYAKFLAERFGKYSNIIWMNGGDTKGADALGLWNALGSTLKKYDPAHLITFHPRGRSSSADWFQQEPWLDFNIFQSGHKDYIQDTSSTDNHHYGEDNWRYVDAAYHLAPVKPILDGEPSYENIPHGLHDSLQARWTADDVRRYAYWSVFAGAAGFTYGENAVMQFYIKGTKAGAFGVNDSWTNTIHDPGATQMHWLKELMLSKSYFDRKPAQEIVSNNNGKRYDYIIATKGSSYALVYTYAGKNFSIDYNKLGFVPKSAAWFDPRTGKTTVIDQQQQTGIITFDPPGEPKNGNDWVLMIT